MSGIVLTDLRKSFGDVRAVDGIDIAIEPGETVALLGPNGAGKSTTIDMLLGLQKPDDGTITVFGKSPTEAVDAGEVGAMLQAGSLIRDLSVRELVTVVASLYPKPMGVDEVLDARRPDVDRRPADEQAFRGRDAAHAFRGRARRRPCAAGARRADRCDGRRGATRVLGLHAHVRGPRQDDHLRHALPRRGRPVRRPRSADGARPRGRATGRRRRSRRASGRARSARRFHRCRSRSSRRCRASRTQNAAGIRSSLSCTDSDAAIRALLDATRRREGHRDPRRRSRRRVPAADRERMTYLRYELVRILRSRRFFFLALGFPLVLYYLIAGPNRHESNIGSTGISLRSTTWSGLPRSGR